MADYTLFKWVFDLTFVPDTADYFSCNYRETGAVLVGLYLAFVLAFFQNRCLFCHKTGLSRFALYFWRLWGFVLGTIPEHRRKSADKLTSSDLI
jgi:hypothetical protein